MFRVMLTMSVLLCGSIGCSDGQQPTKTLDSPSVIAGDPKPAMLDDEMKALEWMQYDVVNQERRLRVRLRPDVGIIDDRLSTLVIVEWIYEENETSLPTADVQKQMDELEEALRPLSDHNRSSRLLMTAIGAGRAEWVFYVKDYPHFEAQFNEHMNGVGPFPIDLRFSRDAEWTYVHGMQARLLTKIEEKEKIGSQPSRETEK